MSTPTSPVADLPQRSSTISSTLTRRTSVSEDEEAIPDSDGTGPTNLLLERLRAWKHLCGNFEHFVSATAKIQKSQSKDYEKVLKAVSEPLRESHHFSDNPGGIASSWDNLRVNTQGMVNMYLDTERSLKTIVLPILERLHKEIKGKAKELKTGASKSAKAVEKARGVTQKHIELLAQQAASFDAAAHAKVEQSNDPYILRRGINHRLNKQVIEENNNRKDILAVQNSFQQFETHIVQTIQGTLDQFFQVVGGQLDKQRAMYGDILANFQRIPADFEWVNFAIRNDQTLLNPDSPPRSLSNISYPNQDHRSTQALIEGNLDRKSRAVIKGYSTGHYVVTPSRYLHEFKDSDDFRHDPSPDLSLYLPDCIVGSIDGVKFTVKGKDISSGKVGNAFHTNSELSFKARSPNDAEKWWSAINDAHRGNIYSSAAVAPAAVGATTTATDAATGAVPATVQPVETEQKDGGVVGGAGGGVQHDGPPAYSEKGHANEAVNVNGAESSSAAATGAGAVPSSGEKKSEKA